MDKYGLFLRKSKRYSLIDPTGQSNQIESIDTGSGPSFEDILEARLPAGTVKISPDVTESLQMAGIELTPMELDRLGRGIDKLAEEGGQDGLLLSEKAGFVVDVSTRTLTSVVPVEDVKNKVFTAIDSAIVIDEG